MCFSQFLEVVNYTIGCIFISRRAKVLIFDRIFDSELLVFGRVAKLVDAQCSERCGLMLLEVQVLSRPQKKETAAEKNQSAVFVGC